MIVHRWFAEQIAYLMDALNIDDPLVPGTKIIDNTVIYWSNELGHPKGHRSYDIPTIVAGGGGGKLKTGRYLDVEALNGGADFAHNRVLTSVCQLMGVDTDYFGSPALASDGRFRGTVPTMLI